MRTTIFTDRDLGDELPLPSRRPLGYRFGPCFGKEFVILSKKTGVCKHFFDAAEDALPFMRMLALERVRSGGPLDFRLYQWDRVDKAWVPIVMQVQVEVRERLLKAA
jgi:hypothetical protein